MSEQLATITKPFFFPIKSNQVLSLWLTTTEAAEIIGCGRHNVVKAIRTGTLAAERRGKQWFIHRDDAIRYRDSERKPGPKPERNEPRD